VGGGAWPFLVGGVICLVNSVNERDLNLLNSCANSVLPSRSLRWAVSGTVNVCKDFLEGLFAYIANGSLRQKQVCDALRCSGLHARYTDVCNELSWPDGVG
jgi:hypothetical protein